MPFDAVDSFLSDLEVAVGIAGAIVARDGAKFLPIFLRLENEMAARDTQAAAIRRAIEAAGIRTR